MEAHMEAENAHAMLLFPALYIDALTFIDTRYEHAPYC